MSCLVNNAAVTTPHRTETKAEEELQWAVYVLAYHRVTKALLPALCRSADTGTPARVVFVASSYAGGLDLTDPQFKKRRYNSNDA